MRLLIDAELREIKAGVEAYARTLHLAGHGVDSDDAVGSLRRGVTAWAAGLQRRGELERVLKARRVRWEPGDGPVIIEIIRASA